MVGRNGGLDLGIENVTTKNVGTYVVLDSEAVIASVTVSASVVSAAEEIETIIMKKNRVVANGVLDSVIVVTIAAAAVGMNGVRDLVSATVGIGLRSVGRGLMSGKAVGLFEEIIRRRDLVTIGQTRWFSEADRRGRMSTKGMTVIRHVTGHRRDGPAAAMTGHGTDLLHETETLITVMVVTGHYRGSEGPRRHPTGEDPLMTGHLIGGIVGTRTSVAVALTEVSRGTERESLGVEGVGEMMVMSLEEGHLTTVVRQIAPPHADPVRVDQVQVQAEAGIGRLTRRLRSRNCLLLLSHESRRHRADR
mmetsp:Transcript_5333/g.8255  ORF Transcript_5333/g.8255 Transcript_5333/m.8255 type:complete len:306 (+) Transcript_5333:2047-2964(+)